MTLTLTPAGRIEVDGVEYAIVPVEPTAYMLCEGADAQYAYEKNSSQIEYNRLESRNVCYRAMTEAAPPMPEGVRRAVEGSGELREALSKAQARPVGPDRCPFTGREFWGNITHEDLGEVATYGGPFDTYTIPQRDDDDPDYYVYRFDQDQGCWVDGVESIGMALVDDQLYTTEDDPEETAEQLKQQADRIEALQRELAEARGKQSVQQEKAA